MMTTALQKYKTMVDKDVWKQKSKRELEFIAMMNHHVEEAKKKLVPKQAKKSNAKAAGKSATRTTHGNTGDWAWKGVAPVGNEPTERTFRGKKYIYCDHGDTKWVLEEKRGVKHIHACSKVTSGSVSDTASSSGSSSGGGETKATPKKQSAWTKALAAMQEDVSTVTEPEVEEENLD